MHGGGKVALVTLLRTSPNHHTRLAHHLKRLIIIIVACLIMLGAAATYFLINSKAPVVHGTPQQQVVQVVTRGGATTHTIISTLGFSVSYTGSALSVQGQTTNAASTSTEVTGQSYQGNDLNTARPYSVVEFTVSDTKTGQMTAINPELSIYTNIRKEYWTNMTAKPGNAGKSQIDMLQAEVTSDEAKDEFHLTSTATITINKVSYRQLTYTQANSDFGAAAALQDIYYLTVQNDRPYFISITDVNRSNNSLVPEYQAIIKTIVYGRPASGALAFALMQARITAATTAPTFDTLPSGTSHVPQALDASTVMDVVAANQPAVVRIASNECADVTLLLPDGSVGVNLGKACMAGVGSGTFVSSDGYIATNGHVVRFSPEDIVTGYINLATPDATFNNHLRTLFQYFIAAGIATQGQLEQLEQSYDDGDTSAASTISSLGSLVPVNDIQISHSVYSYAVQTSDVPIRYNIGTNTFDYTKTVISAKFVDASVDMAVLEQDGLGGSASQTSATSDVGILKASGTFPTVQLGSLSGISDGSQLTAMGYPAFVDGGLETTKQQTVPSVTQGIVESMAPQSAVNPHILLITTVPIAEGNSGGPSFNDNGQEIGLNTYGASTGTCASPTNCFGDGIVRDIDDYKALVSADNITLKTDSPISDSWKAGLVALTSNNYSAALTDFQKSQSLYPANYLAPSFIAIAQQQVDVLRAARNQAILRVVLIIVALLIGIGIIVAVILVVHLLRHKPQTPLVGSRPPQPPITPPMQPPAALPPPPLAMPVPGTREPQPSSEYHTPQTPHF